MNQSKLSDYSIVGLAPKPEPHFRFRIIHLLLWLTSCAAYLAIASAFKTAQSPAERVTIVIEALVSGTVLISLVALICQHVSNNFQMFRHPGHWLLLAISPSILGNSPLQLMLSMAEAHSLVWLYDLMWSVFLLFAAIAITASVKFIQGLLWKTSMLIFASVLVLQGLVEIVFLFRPADYGFGKTMAFLLSMSNFGTFVALLLLGMIMAAELIAGHRRDWLHWIGASACLTPFVTMLVGS
jgi:hypothetical protein